MKQETCDDSNTPYLGVNIRSIKQEITVKKTRQRYKRSSRLTAMTAMPATSPAME